MLSKEEYEQKCRELAYKLWQEAGCPQGRDKEFYAKAEDIIRQQTGFKK